MQIGLKRLRAFLIVPRILHFFLFMGCLLNFDRHFWFLICFQAEMFMLNPLLNFRLTVDECHCSRLLSLPGSGLVTNRGIGQFIVSRGDWLGKPANIKVENSGAVVYVGSSLTVNNREQWINAMSLLVNKIKMIGMLLNVVHGQVQKSWQKHTTKESWALRKAKHVNQS